MIVIRVFKVNSYAARTVKVEKELPGYLEYKKRVRWRLVPGIW